MKFSRIAAALSAALLCVCLLDGCKTKKSGSSSGSGAANSVSTAYPDKEAGFQLDKPAAGDEIAVMHTSMGDISIRFFPEAAPKAVENFTTHAKNGYFNGLTFHRVIENFMIQSGDPKGDGTGGESIWGTDFEDEFDSKLLNLRGAVAMANSGPNTNGSQFFINQAQASQFQGKDGLESQAESAKTQCQQQYQTYQAQLKGKYSSWQDYYKAAYGFDPSLVPDSVWDLYGKTGGNINLDAAYRYSGGYTVFGQAFDGLDVVDKIAAVKVDSNDKPTAAVTIKSIDITTYQG